MLRGFTFFQCSQDRLRPREVHILSQQGGPIALAADEGEVEMDMVHFLANRSVPFEQLDWDAETFRDHQTDSQHLRGRHVARTALLKTPDGFVIAILPWAFELDYEALETLLGVRPIFPAGDDERAALFPEWGDGLVPPIGSVFGIRTVMDIHLAGCASILFRRSEDGECIRMDLADFRDLEHPITGKIAIAPQPLHLAT